MTNAGSDKAASAPTRRRLAALVFTDMVGYTELVQRDELRGRHLLELQRRQVRIALKQFGGQEIDVVGDGFLLEFPSVLHALQFAVALQQRLAAGGEG